MDTTLNSFPSPLSACRPALPVLNPLYPSLPTAIGLPSNFDLTDFDFLPNPQEATVDYIDGMIYAVEDWEAGQAQEAALGNLSVFRFNADLIASQRIILGQGTYDQCKALCRIWRLNKPTRRTLIVLPKPLARPTTHWG